MADRYQSYMTIPINTTSVTVDVFLAATTSGAGIPNKAAGQLCGAYVRRGGSVTPIVFSALSSVAASWASGGFVEYDCIRMCGLYRCDIPDAAFASGADGGAIHVTLADGSSRPDPLRYVLTNPSFVGCALLGAVVEGCGNYTAKQALDVSFVALAGVTASCGTVLKTPDGGTTRITATIDANAKTRTAMTISPSS